MEKQNILNTKSSLPINVFVKDVIEDPKYIHLQEKFEKVFRSKGFSNQDKFDKKVFFLKNDQNFQIMSQSNLNSNLNYTPLNNKLYDILTELNENGNDFSKLSVRVDYFIYKVCEVLLNCQRVNDRSEEIKTLYDVDKNKNYIEEKLLLLSQFTSKVNDSQDLNSSLKISFNHLDNFPVGTYSSELKVVEILSTKDGNPQIKTKHHDLSKQIKIDKEGVTNFKSSPKENNSINEYVFPLIQFTANDLSYMEEMINNQSISGTSLSNFSIIIGKTPDFWESKIVYLLDLMLNFINDLLDVSRGSFTKTMNLKLKSKKSNGNDRNINIEMHFSFDPLTRANVLRRVKGIFDGVLESLNSNKMIIDEILDGYFSEIADSAKYILSLKKDESRENCCKCLIF